MSKRGFTLIEVLTTITIIGVLVGITSLVYSSSLKRSRDGQRKTDLDTIKNTIEQYYLDNRSYVVFDKASGEISSARWQLDNRSIFGSCKKNIAHGTLSPSYITAIPEDPLKKVSINAVCAELTGSNLANQYLYFAGKSNDSKPKDGYYLLARMETNPRVNLTAGACTDSSTVCFTRNELIIDWGYGLNGLSIGNDTVATTSHNYKATATPNN